MKQRNAPWYVFGLGNLVVVLGLGLGFWYLLIDPSTSVVNSYPEPFDDLLFWAIISVVFLGFNLDFHPFERIGQPVVRGLVTIGVIVGLSFGITYLFEGWGHFNPTFSSGVPMGNGFFAAALFVLFAFFTYLTQVINWDHWPWRHLGLKQPWIGIAEIGTWTGPTVVLYALFGSTNLAPWAKPLHNLLDVPTTIGVVYSIIVVVVITGLITENWPWRLAGAGARTEFAAAGRTAITSFVGNICAGIILYFLLRWLALAIMGSHTFTALPAAAQHNEFPAQIGVCWVFWMILWSNCFHNKPTDHGPLVNYAVRFVVTLVLGIGTFALYFYVLAGHVLGEPAIVGNVHGNALGFMNWLILWILFYTVCLGAIGIPGAPEVTEEDPDPYETVLDRREGLATHEPGHPEGAIARDGGAAGVTAAQQSPPVSH